MSTDDRLEYPSYCCQLCGEPIGYLGRFFQWVFGICHGCNPLED